MSLPIVVSRAQVNSINTAICDGRASRPLNHQWVSRLSKEVGTSHPSLLKDLTTLSGSGGHTIWLASVRSPRVARLWQDRHDLVGSSEGGWCCFWPPLRF